MSQVQQLSVKHKGVVYTVYFEDSPRPPEAHERFCFKCGERITGECVVYDMSVTQIIQEGVVPIDMRTKIAEACVKKARRIYRPEQAACELHEEDLTKQQLQVLDDYDGEEF